MRNLFKIELNTNRVFGLDILRAFAILFVVIGHGNSLLPESFKKAADVVVFDGVSVFFVLSGFLIGGILIKLIDKHPLDKALMFNFWVRRWYRTLPNYFLVLIILGILHLSFTENFSFWDIKKFFLFSQNLYHEQPMWFFPEAWSLSVEEWFYLTVPVLIASSIYFFKIKPRLSVPLVAALILIAVTAFRYYRFETVSIGTLNEWDGQFRKQVITRLDSLMFGVIGAYIHFYYSRGWARYKNSLLCIGITLFLLSKFVFFKYSDIGGLYSTVFSFTILSLSTLLMLPFLSNLKTGEGILYKGFTYISLTSYSMYLLNLSIIQDWIIKKIPWTFSDNEYLIALSQYGLYWFLVIALSILLYKYFEVPMMNLRDSTKVKRIALAVSFKSNTNTKPISNIKRETADPAEAAQPVRP